MGVEGIYDVVNVVLTTEMSGSHHLSGGEREVRCRVLESRMTMCAIDHERNRW
jgi:hypothetical protein